MLGLSSGAAGPVWADNPADIAAARELFKEGAALSKTGQWDDARVRFEQSLSLKRSALTLYSLGVAQKETGRLVEALESFRAFLVESENEMAQPFIQPAKTAIADLEARVAGMSIRLDPPAEGAEVWIDGRQVPGAALATMRIVNPGIHSVVVQAPGRRPAEANLTLEEGQRAKVTLQLVPVREPTHAPPTLSLAPSSPSAAPTPPPWGPALFAGGVSSMVVGAAFGAFGAAQLTYAEGLGDDSAGGKLAVSGAFAAVGVVATIVGAIVMTNDGRATKTSGHGGFPSMSSVSF